jgi:D-3-phosphoglycerate dehydrogenase
MKKLSVLVTDAIDREGLDPLTRHPGIDTLFELKPSPEKLEKALLTTQVWLVRSETKVTKEWIEKSPELRLIGRAGVGVDNIDIEAAKLRGITVINAPDANTISACEHAFGLMIALSRHISQAHSDIKEGRWQKSKWMGMEMHGKTLGIIGFGRIGQAMASRAIAFGMNVLTFDPFASLGQTQKAGVRLTSLKELLCMSDFVTLHTPLSKETRYLINAESLAWMKKGSRLINCARGGLVDEKALAHAIDSGHLSGAALDVFEKEPLPEDSPLRTLPSVLLTPHLGASTHDAQIKVSREIAEKVIAFYEKLSVLKA